MSLENNLKQIGLEEKEAKVYLAALELGPSNIQSLTRKSGVKRSTVDVMIKNLKKMNLISETVKGKRKVFIAASPENLKKSIKAKEQLLEEMLPELRSINNIGSVKPRIMFFEGKEGIREIYKDTLGVKNKMTLWISPIQSMLENIGEDFLNKYVEERTRRGIWVKSVYITSQNVSDYKYLKPETFKKTLRKIRFTPEKISIANTMCIYDDKVAIMSSQKESFGFVVESRDYANMMTVCHDLLWQISKPYEDFQKNEQAAQKATEEDIYY